ncbi:hypothetical protein Vadar_015464 [Vaccinium darrowii]|uniref:Uncharacterized protein n=1 Tax=Vaccinium darrowii TaxID=229202 RepID=A0ACB7YEX3_9ERIC|nr:hypothetical protein Vadar_015464 [Vaccinium darrowii]
MMDDDELMRIYGGLDLKGRKLTVWFGTSGCHKELANAARRWALDILERRRPWAASLHRTDKIESLGEAREILKFARAQARKQAPNLGHPIVCIDVIEAGIVSGPRAGLWKEAEGSQRIVHTETCKSLIHFFFAQHGTSRASL